MGNAIERQPLSVWIRNHTPKSEMIFRSDATAQFEFLTKLSELLFPNESTRERCAAVIGTHRSKSIELPVVEFQLPKVRIVMRDNFYDWKVSVQDDDPITLLVGDLFDPWAEHSSCYCEGFSEYDVFGSFYANRRRFTVSIGSDEKLMKFCLSLAGISLLEDPRAPSNPSE